MPTGATCREVVDDILSQVQSSPARNDRPTQPTGAEEAYEGGERPRPPRRRAVAQPALENGLKPIRARRGGGVTFQQVQKYEKGANRISAGRLIQFAEKLGVKPAYFVDGIADGSKVNGDAAKNARAIDSVAATDEGVAVLEAMAQMEPTRRKFMVTLARALGDMK